MKLKKQLFPFVLILAIILTVAGLVTVNMSFSIPNDEQVKSLSINIDNIETKNVELIGYDATSISYVLDLGTRSKECEISFDVKNDSSFDMKLYNTYMDEIPDEIKNIVTLNIIKSDVLDKNTSSRVTYKYTVKDSLTYKEAELLKKYNKLKISVLFNYIQA